MSEIFSTASDRIRLRTRHENWRILKDKVFAAAMGVGGVTVIVAILLIFFYLIYEVFPLFRGATIEPLSAYDLGAPGSAHLALDEYAEIGLSVDARGRYTFFHAHSGHTIARADLAGDHTVNAISVGDPADHTIAIATAGGRVFIARPEYEVSYPDDVRRVTPTMTFPLGPEPLTVVEDGEPIVLVTAESGEEETTIAALTASGRLFLLNVTAQTSFLDDAVTLALARYEIPLAGAKASHIAIDIDQRELYVANDGGLLSYYDIQNKDAIVLVDRIPVARGGAEITAIEFLSGGISLLVGDTAGEVTQWFPIRTAEASTLSRVRTFESLPAPVCLIAPEHFRKGFAAIDERGNIGLYHATAERTLVTRALKVEAATALAIAPRADVLIVAADGAVKSFIVHNEHPEVSLRSIWGEVWYESRQQPEYIWQSSSASSDFEPKFSLTPLAFGTFKAAFYAMVFATPLAIFGAIYTAYFMTPRMRAVVKPSIEVMAALPTVILGFLAGLWLAPLVEKQLLGVLLLAVTLPAAILAAAFAWGRLPDQIQRLFADGWEAALLIPVIGLATWLSLIVGQLLEVAFFAGSLAHWLSVELGIPYDQRNSLVVGMAMAFAVIPTIFSISEDAVFGVPRHLTTGSLALGATPWQTVTRIVLLTASPGIFSAVMIGMGRAIGETMIVLMATGNTPIMDFNVFQGFRALSANIAVEMPESEVNSTHYRILFLAALVLFIVTFFFNTVAEVVRQRLREKYASL